MARLTESDKTQLLEATRRQTSNSEQPPSPEILSIRDYVSFCQFAAKFSRAEDVAARASSADGDHWLL